MFQKGLPNFVPLTPPKPLLEIRRTMRTLPSGAQRCGCCGWTWAGES